MAPPFSRFGGGGAHHSVNTALGLQPDQEVVDGPDPCKYLRESTNARTALGRGDTGQGDRCCGRCP